jgi:N-acetylglucosamine kinase-like BadF-type ATPase
MTFAVGVDGGGSVARAVVIDDAGHELSRAEAPGAVVAEAAPGDAASAVAEAVRAATARAGTELPADALWAGLAGAGREAARRAVTAELERHCLAARVHVGTDVEAAFHAAFPEGPGILLVAGTGSIAWARDAQGRVARAGGWGQLLGDEGSGYAIGLGALRAVVRGEDGRGAATQLRGQVLAAVGVERPDALISWAAAASKADLARLVSVVEAAVARGDRVAEGLLYDAAADLERHVTALVARSGPWPAPPGVALSGGLIAEGGPLRARVLARLAAQPVAVRTDAVDAALGAARLALALLARR